MNMRVQNYLLTHSLSDLERDHAVKARWSQDRSKFSLNYDMIESRESDKLACECRGLVLAPVQLPKNDDEPVGETEVLGRPMYRFFNHGQSEAAKINFEAKNTRFYNKLDGSFTMLYYDKNRGEWCVATRSVPDADQPLFELALSKCFYGKSFKQFTERLEKDCSFIFELCSPMNRIVVDYQDYSITLLAVIENNTGREFDIEPWGTSGVVPKVCQTYKLGNLDEMIAFVSSRNPLEHEGIVVCDENFNRVKVKNPSYLALNRVRDSVAKSPRALMELCLQGKIDDVVSLLPEYLLDRALEMREALRTLIRSLDDQYLECLREAKEKSNGYDERKQLALAVNRHKDPKSSKNHSLWMGYTMHRYEGKCSDFQGYAKFQIDPETGRYRKSFLDNLLRCL